MDHIEKNYKIVPTPVFLEFKKKISQFNIQLQKSLNC